MGLLRRQRETLHMSDRLTRVAIVNAERCKPSRCRQECKRSCPVVLQGKLCIEVNSKAKIAWISEFLCIGCGICVKKCPFDAIIKPQYVDQIPKAAKGTVRKWLDAKNERDNKEETSTCSMSPPPTWTSSRDCKRRKSSALS